MPHYFNGLCYATPALVLPAVVATYPKIDTLSAISIITPAPTINANGLVTLRISRFDYQSQKTQVFTSTLQLSPCNSIDVPFNYGTAGALWALAFTFTVAIYFVTRGIGTFLSMIRH